MRSLRIAVAIGLAAGGLLAPSVASARSDVKAGIEAWQAGDHAKAIAIWRPLAERGDADASFNLAQAYRLGRGTPIDLGQAQKWFELAARAGHLDAQTSLGLLLFQNGNRVAAARWLKSAAEKGEPRAMLVYGTALFNGDGVTRDPVLAYAFVSRAAAQGLAPAKSTLDEMDKVLPIDDRLKGVSLAKGMVRENKAAAVSSTPGAKVQPTARTPTTATARPAAVSAAKSPPPLPSTGGAWRIQLGAFSQRSSADALFGRLKGSLGGAQAFVVPAGKVFRLQAGPYASKGSADAACKAVAATGQACFSVPAK